MIQIDLLHLPDSYGQTGKPHIAKVAGSWGAFWPGPQPQVPPANYMAFAEYLRKLNGHRCWRPGSMHIAPPARLQ